jgi:hypothetical protein
MQATLPTGLRRALAQMTPASALSVTAPATAATGTSNMFRVVRSGAAGDLLLGTALNRSDDLASNTITTHSSTRTISPNRTIDRTRLSRTSAGVTSLVARRTGVEGPLGTPGGQASPGQPGPPPDPRLPTTQAGIVEPADPFPSRER